MLLKLLTPRVGAEGSDLFYGPFAVSWEGGTNSSSSLEGKYCV